MELKPELQSPQTIPHLYPLYILDDPSLITNPKYLFLIDRLRDFYSSLQSFPLVSLYSNKPTSFQKQLYVKLKSLLTEIVLTKDLKRQENLLEKTYKWYLDQIGLPRTQNPSTSSLTPTVLRNDSIDLPRPRKKVKIVNKNSQMYFPKKLKEKSRESLIEKCSIKYQRMLEKEKLDFGVPLTHGLPDKKKEVQIATQLAEENAKETEDSPVVKRPSRTPTVLYDNFAEKELFNPIKDFRKIAHKFRMIKPAVLNREAEQILHDEAQEIAEIKIRMARKRMPVNIKTLEHGLIVHQKVKLNTSSQKKLPSGGELLLKSRFPFIKNRSSSTPRKQGP